ncbi:MAG: NADH:ubiquinone reductase (Na(+)-transporting) subunit D [Verrucomicrobiota bacterium]|jgi:Na+-transporting NADH:ubiquinone oxidoreductase subunit D|nr:NADH:ubiquinone reductase (Na(+)-transporting) subunit D [Kiritimatiellaceae bacterium]MEC7908503.1 NADH:ubiquinone reductase (Na(+)-transporting) subunit D [Verrucomicrobiota bacterium]MEC8517712.1 NADH:ubiquinone reductase (Na(+)-transporting) subunit D [Verrucomicrobiota bacterium]MEC8753877.1 NADH:ubiquinone reductase (Na(+)-transporting) subunit D [Verrucomicrobiota bacterium]|tara:strand:- start:515 stop:1132 length:618 start_codon:yes stop_codon:yes gene_type:complete
MPSNKKILFDPFSDNNPISVAALGVCSALAVTVKLETAVVMTLALTFVVTLSNLIISLLRKHIPGGIRMIVEMSIIASLVIVADQLLQAYLFDLSKQLSVFVGLIITNCIVMGRAEAFALQNGPKESILDGLGNGIGYGWILIAVAAVRELFGFGELFGFKIFNHDWLIGEAFQGNGLLLLAPGAFIILGLLIWIQRTLNKFVEE